MQKGVKLYNIIFPIWLLWILPVTWVVVLPANFLIDLLVVVITMKFLDVSEIKTKIRGTIWKVWIMGFVADFIGTFAMFCVNLIDFKEGSKIQDWWYTHFANPVSYNPFSSFFAFLWVTCCITLTAVLIYFFNDRWCLKKAGLEDGQRKAVALSLAVFTAPYLFYLPTEFFF
ncbi:MAG: hypothetical protein ACI39N_04780 [Lachnospiraceae bacterium]